MARRQRFRGRIAGVGSTAGIRVVVGWWTESPFGEFVDAMVERADGHRVLLAPSRAVADLVATTYTFDEIRVEAIGAVEQGGRAEAAGAVDRIGRTEAAGAVDRIGRTEAPGATAPAAGRPATGGGGDPSWTVSAPSLSLSIGLGGRTLLGGMLRAVPRPVAESPTFATLADPVARVVLRGVRTRGTARAGRREYYGATDVHAVTTLHGSFDGLDLGSLAPVDPPCRFGFSSTPRRPSVTSVTTTIVDHS